MSGLGLCRSLTSGPSSFSARSSSSRSIPATLPPSALPSPLEHDGFEIDKLAEAWFWRSFRHHISAQPEPIEPCSRNRSGFDPRMGMAFDAARYCRLGADAFVERPAGHD